MEKRFILDTNVLLYDPKSIDKFDNEVIIPIAVLDELDMAKLSPDEKGRNARIVIRQLDKLRSYGKLSEGVQIPNGPIVKVESKIGFLLPEALNLSSVDNQLLSVALSLEKNKENLEDKIIVVTRDINLRVKCDALDILAEDYEPEVIESTSSLYQGFSTIDVSPEKLQMLYDNGFITLDIKGYINQFFLLKSSADPKQTGLTRLYDNNVLKLVPPKCTMWGINPRNVEQRMAMDLLLDPNISFVTLVGRAGSGKTLLAAAAALHLVLEQDHNYSRILLSRPIQPMGKDLGYLPGTVDEKLQPWMSALQDNLELLMDPRQLDMYKEKGIIQLESLTHIRGRSIPNSFMILDEAQNLSAQEIKTIITRIGEGTKLVLTGDIEQIDNPSTDFSNNGLSYAIEKLKKYDLTGHIVLSKGERSRLSSLGAEVL